MRLNKAHKTRKINQTPLINFFCVRFLKSPRLIKYYTGCSYSNRRLEKSLKRQKVYELLFIEDVEIL